MSLEQKVRQLYNDFGQRKQMGISVLDTKRPHFFLHRTFMSENDLLVILNTKRCAYQCYFCQLPAKSSTSWISTEDILAQFEYVVEELKHSLSIIDRVTLSNEGSILDTGTMPAEALLTIAKCVNEMRRVHTLVIESRLEFVVPSIIQQIKLLAPRVTINILTGFETQDSYIRDKILFKQETLSEFEAGLDLVAKCQAHLTAYILFKPSPEMTDTEATVEARLSIDYLAGQCTKRNIPLTIRLNPMYAAQGSSWAKIANKTNGYKPPRLTDVFALAKQATQEGLRIYVGLSTEDLDNGNSYKIREDYSKDLLKEVIRFNNQIPVCYEETD